ncbi:hypothetical protein [Streptomyces sp. NPDC006691]|uniref:hypothetical protein n=1 Tax=Streptomyces sp. NPDC006691 TaxID=3364757 RepID=UPI00367B1E6F
MSRETDSSSSGRQGRGTAGYPSGTPPYGTPSSPGQDTPEATGEPDEPKTETTLTTRIRINIPGSRPIPPVVMRTPMSDIAKAPEADGEGERTGSVPRPDAPAPEPEEPAAGERPASDWFAPRKSASAPGSSATPPGGTPRPDLPYFSDGPGAAAQNGGTGAGPNGPATTDRANGLGGSDGSLPGEPSGPTTGPVTGNAALPVRPVGNRPGARPGPEARPGEPSLFGAAPGQPPAPAADLGRGPDQRPRQGADLGFDEGPRPGEAARPGQNPLTSPGGGHPFAPGGPGPAPALSDDTAILTPQTPAPSPLTHSVGNPLANPAVNPAAPAPGGHVSGDTLTSGIPVIPPEHRGASFPAGPAMSPGGPTLTPPPAAGQDAAEPPAAPKKTSAPAKKKGRSKLALLGGGVIVLAGVAYGAGLVLNHSEVPKGTTVLGVDIGGGTKEAAVSKLDQTLGKRANQPLHLTVDGKQEQLKPEIAGLSLDSQATVRAAAGSDYNPVSVIGSLFGGKRVAEPVIPVDEEKLGVALTDLAGASGSASEGTIKFVPGKAVAVPGKAGKSLDVNRSMIAVKDAYRTLVQTGKADAVPLPVAVRQPTVGQAEIDRAMDEFAKPAMSANVTIKAGGKSLPFGPLKSLPKILSMKADNGKLVEVYDKAAITELIGSTFKGVMVTQGGQKHEVSADDVAVAMKTALRGKTTAQRTVTID